MIPPAEKESYCLPVNLKREFSSDLRCGQRSKVPFNGFSGQTIGQYLTCAFLSFSLVLGLFFQFLLFLPKGRALRTIPRIVLLKISKDGDATASLGNLFQQRHRCVTNTVSGTTLKHRTCFSSQRSCRLNSSVAQLWLCC